MKSTMSRHMKPQHLRATRAFGYAVTSHNYAGWYAASTLFAFHLKPSEAAALVIAAAGALDDRAFETVVQYLQGDDG